MLYVIEELNLEYTDIALDVAERGDKPHSFDPCNGAPRHKTVDHIVSIKLPLGEKY